MNISNTMININLQQRTVLGTFTLLLVMVCATFVYTIWQWRSDWILAHQQLEETAVIKNNNNENLIASIPDAHLFGKAAPNIAHINEVPISSLQLQVKGIVKQNNGQSKVLISTAGQPSKIYKIGDAVSSGVKVYGITTDTVILENNGRMEKLPLLREKLQFKPRTKEGQ